jgi:hypothetical protein
MGTILVIALKAAAPVIIDAAVVGATAAAAVVGTLLKTKVAQIIIVSAL